MYNVQCIHKIPCYNLYIRVIQWQGIVKYLDTKYIVTDFAGNTTMYVRAYAGAFVYVCVCACVCVCVCVFVCVCSITDATPGPLPSDSMPVCCVRVLGAGPLHTAKEGCCLPHCACVRVHGVGCSLCSVGHSCTWRPVGSAAACGVCAPLIPSRSRLGGRRWLVVDMWRHGLCARSLRAHGPSRSLRAHGPSQHHALGTVSISIIVSNGSVAAATL